MTRIATDQGEKEARESVLICAICGSKQTEPGEEKALAGFAPFGHPRSHIQSALSIPLARPSLTP